MKNIINIFYENEQPQDDSEEWGWLYIDDIKCRVLSGRWGRGYAPRGSYRGYNIINYTDKSDSNYYAMGLFGIAFQLPLQLLNLLDTATPQEKARAEGMSGIAIHPDGGVKGTKGCFGLEPIDEAHLFSIKMKIEEIIKKFNFINVEVR